MNFSDITEGRFGELRALTLWVFFSHHSVLRDNVRCVAKNDLISLFTSVY